MHNALHVTLMINQVEDKILQLQTQVSRPLGSWGLDPASRRPAGFRSELAVPAVISYNS